MYHCFLSISRDNWKFSVSLKHTAKWEWVLLNLMAGESLSQVFKYIFKTKQNKTWAWKVKFSLPVFALLVIFSSPALIPHSERVKSLIESHRHWVSKSCLFSTSILFLTNQEPKVLKVLFLKLPSSVPQSTDILTSSFSTAIGTTHWFNKHLLSTYCDQTL